MTPQPLTLDYLKSLKLCWSPAMLEAAAADWPPSPTWAWFLGPHIATMDRASKQQRVAVAFAVIAAKSFELPIRTGVAFAWFKRASDDQYTAAAAALGAWLDALDQTTSDALAALLQQTPGG
jgi:hypothetical protein